MAGRIVAVHVSAGDSVTRGTPLVVLGGRAAESRWGSGSLQEFDHVPVLAPITKHAATVKDPAGAAAAVQSARRRLGGEPVDETLAAGFWQGLRDQSDEFFVGAARAVPPAPSASMVTQA